MTTSSQLFREAFRTISTEFTPLARAGTAAFIGGCAVSKLLSDEQKEAIVHRYASIVRSGINPNLITEKEIRASLWNNCQSGSNVIVSSPVFYGMYHLIHLSKLSMTEHVARAALRGFSGTAATVPTFMVMYGSAAALLPWLQSQYMERGFSKASAKDLSEATVFLALAAPVECAAEAVGCKVTASQMRSRLFPLATALIAARLASGVLVQYQAVDAGDTSSTRKLEDLTRSVVGTTFAQHGINASMKALSDEKGLSGFMNYLKSGDTSGAGTLQKSGRQLAGTLAQRICFVALWNELSHQKTTPPAWAISS